MWRRVRRVWCGGQFRRYDSDELHLLNPGVSRWATPPGGPYRLLVPIDQANDLQERIDHITQGHGLSVVFDHLGGQSLIDGLHSLAPLGTLVSYNIVQGMPTEDVFQAMRHLLGKSLAVRCFSMHTFDEDVAIRRALMQEAIGLMANAQVKAPECQVFKFSEVRQTHALLDGGMVRGKLVMHP